MEDLNVCQFVLLVYFKNESSLSPFFDALLGEAFFTFTLMVTGSETSSQILQLR